MGPFLVRTGQTARRPSPSPSLPPNPATNNGRGNRSARPARPTQTGCEPVSPRGPGSPPATSAQRGRVASRACPSVCVFGGKPPLGSGVAPASRHRTYGGSAEAKRKRFRHTEMRVLATGIRQQPTAPGQPGFPRLFSCRCLPKMGRFSGSPASRASDASRVTLAASPSSAPLRRCLPGATPGPQGIASQKRHAKGRAGRLSRCREGNAGGDPGPLLELRAPSCPPPYEERHAHAAAPAWVWHPRAAIHDGRAYERRRYA